jgi:uncharacterized membrane protein YoaK (UPF0700 family)
MGWILLAFILGAIGGLMLDMTLATLRMWKYW